MQKLFKFIYWVSPTCIVAPGRQLSLRWILCRSTYGYGGNPDGSIGPDHVLLQYRNLMINIIQFPAPLAFRKEWLKDLLIHHLQFFFISMNRTYGSRIFFIVHFSTD